ncbi:hypothetical protein E2558_05985 [Staphylococcus pragensis]|uniref:Uncharacterized protein n=1 Tax=Staphylococcus pragensis TaxID=1611836 RepID=A0A4Z1BUY6_9STAP|nr:hypothetical protein CD154_05570 [Staphylococcus carnosus]TGN27392.1 hypothetical protein E2558_05985 [Staphylococcus pragensis]
MPGGRGPNIEIFAKKVYKQSKLGIGALAQRLSQRKSTNKASWGYNEIILMSVPLPFFLHEIIYNSISTLLVFFNNFARFF